MGKNGQDFLARRDHLIESSNIRPKNFCFLQLIKQRGFLMKICQIRIFFSFFGLMKVRNLIGRMISHKQQNSLHPALIHFYFIPRSPFPNSNKNKMRLTDWDSGSGMGLMGHKTEWEFWGFSLKFISRRGSFKFNGRLEWTGSSIEWINGIYNKITFSSIKIQSVRP